MSDTSPCSLSEGSDATLINQHEFDVYLQAVFGYIHTQNYEIVSSSLRVLKYSEDSPNFWNNLRQFIRSVSTYQFVLNEDLVLVIQDGADICDEIVSFLAKKKRYKYKYLIGLNNCFIITIISPPHDALSSAVGDYLLKQSELGKLVDNAPFLINVGLHSMFDICSNLFVDPHSAVGADKKDGHGIQEPDYSAYPSYLQLIRQIQGVPTTPTFMIETGVGRQTAKVEVDCISTIIGDRFMVDSVLGIDVNMSQSFQEPESIGFIVFDVSIGAMFDLFNSLSDNYKKALASIVLKRKAQFKLDEVEAIRHLKECIDANGDYKSLCNRIAEQYRQRTKNDCKRYLNAPTIPDRDDVWYVLNGFEFQTTELIDEEKYYQNLINICDEASDYFGVHELLHPDTIRKAEAFVVQQLYRRRKVQTVTAEDHQELIFPSTALSSTYWWKKRKEIVVSSNLVKHCFREASLHCKKGVIGGCMYNLKTPWEHLQQQSHAAVALLNCPGDEETALEHFQQLYDNQSKEPPTITTKLEHWTTDGIKAQLTEWGVRLDGPRYSLMIAFSEKCAEVNRSSYRSEYLVT